MAPFRCDPVFFQNSYDFVLRPVLFQEHSVNRPDELDLFRWAGNENNSVGMDAFPFAAIQDTFVIPVPAAQHSAEPNSSRPPLTIAEFNETALPNKDFRGQLAAVFRRHRAFYGLDDRGCDTAIVIERLRAVVDLNIRAPADVFVIRTLIGILESSPT